MTLKVLTEVLINLGFAMCRSMSRQRTLLAFLVFLVSWGLVVGDSVAQLPQRTQDGRSAGRNPEFLLRSLPVLIALDSNADGVISELEIENASRALKTIDKNKDGQLTSDELRPDFSSRKRGLTEADRRGGLRNSVKGGAKERASENAEVGDAASERKAEMLKRLMQMDEDGDGKLSNKEIPERLQGFLERADQNKDGFATRDELAVLAARVAGFNGNSPAARQGGATAGTQLRDPKQAFARMFEQRDLNKDGKLSADEMPEQMAGRLQQIDADQDGFVSRKEMDEMISRLGNRKPGQQGRAGKKSGFDPEASGQRRAGGEVPKRPDSE